MSKKQDFYRVVISGREVEVESVRSDDPDYAAARDTATIRLAEAMAIMREQAADPAKIDSTHYFVGVEAAKEFARMALKNIEENLDETRDEIEAIRH